MARKRITIFGLLAILISLWGVSKLRSQTPAPPQTQDQQVTPKAESVPSAPAQPAESKPNDVQAPAVDPNNAKTDSPTTSPSEANTAEQNTAEQTRERKVADPGEVQPDDHSVPLAPDVSRRFPLSANLTTPQDPNAYKLSTNVDLVLLDVSVKDTSGGFVSGLSKDQFKIFENGKPQEMRYFEAGDIPVTLGLVVDNSGSMRAKRPDVVTAALSFVTASNPKDQLFVVNFNDRPRLGLPADMAFTDDRIKLRDALLRNPTVGRTAMNDGLKMGLEHLKAGKYYKKTLILISDGGDNASELTNSELCRLVQEYQATIYTIGIYDEDDRDRNPGVLKKIAALTGGECFLPEKLTDLVGVCTRIAKDIRNRYSLGYVPSDTAFDGKPRTLKVIASAPDRGKLAVRSRTSYIVAAPAGQAATTMAAKPAKKH
jgi:Ca-activated chloride channel family protein